MSDFKPNEGKAWQTSAEDKQQSMERLMQYDWFQSKSDEQKQFMIPVYSGVLNKVDIPPGCDAYVDICKEVSAGGKPQLALKIRAKNPSQQSAPAASQPASDPFGEDPFAI